MMKPHTALALLFLIASLFEAASAFSQTPADPANPAPLPDPLLAETIARIQSVYEGVQDIQADFGQETRFEGFETVVSSKGRLFIKKPGRFRWEYIEPTHDQVVINEGRAWIYTPRLKQVIVTPFSELSESDIPFRLLTETGRLDRDFEIRWSRIQAPGGPSKAEGIGLELHPRDPKSGLDRIEIVVDPDRYLIRQMELFQTGGSRSRFALSRIRTNKNLRNSLFTFQVPKGVQVIETAPSP
jgi:outer membrane lipoprotein carrier protein